MPGLQSCRASWIIAAMRGRFGTFVARASLLAATVLTSSRLWWCAAIAALALSACTSNKTVDLAIQKYHQGNYVDALEDLKDVEGHEHALNERWNVRYLVFRGLSHFRLYRKHGREEDRTAARRFLTRGWGEYERGPRNFLSFDEERELRLALQAVRQELW